MRKKNAGFTLVEVMIVVAILAVCTAMAAMSLSTISIARVKKCANETDALLSRCKVSAMSKAGEVYLKLYTDDKGRVCGELHEGDKVTTERLGDANVGMSYTVNGTSVTLGANGICLSFQRDTGAFLPLNDVDANIGFADDVYCTALTVTGASSITIELQPATGYHGIG